jgi:hypothetical protein
MNTSFYQENLIEVSSPELVKRYNDALESLGLTPTQLKSFHIDGRGWSPEIAEEQNGDYLSHGPASSLAIILSPDQRTTPLYDPLTSFDKIVLQRYFGQFASEIANITQAAYLCLELDHLPPTYSGPGDVLSFQSVTVKSSAGNFGNALREQETLVKKFLEEDTAWFDPGLRQQIIANAKRYGDLRGRAVIPLDFVIDDVSSFYIKLFSGVYVLRLDRDRTYVIVENKNEMPARQRYTYHMQDTKLLPKLLQEEVIAVDENYYREQPELLRNKYDAVLADALFQLEPTLNFTNLNTAQRKQRLGLYADQLPSVVAELEQFISKLSVGTTLRSGDLSRELILLLLHPHQSTSEQAREVVWQFLCKVQVTKLATLDVAQLYQKDVAHFFELYQSWSTQRRQWAESYLKARGIIS